MERKRLLVLSFVAVHGPEAAGAGVQVPSAVVVEAEVGVELLARVEVVVWRGAGLVDQVAEGVVVVGVADASVLVRQRAHTPVPVVVEVDHRVGRLAVDHVAPRFVDQLQPIRERMRELAVQRRAPRDRLVHHLRVACETERVQEVIRRHACNRLRDAVAITVGNDLNLIGWKMIIFEAFRRGATMGHEPWPDCLFSIDRASASQRVSKVSSSLSWRSSLRFLSVSRVLCIPTIPWAWSWIKTCMPWIPRPSTSACRCFPGHDFAGTNRRSRCLPFCTSMAASPPLSASQHGNCTTPLFSTSTFPRRVRTT